MSNYRAMSLTDFLTAEELDEAVKLGSRKEVLDKIIQPNMERINKQLGQDNDARYLSYAVEYVMMRAGCWK